MVPHPLLKSRFIWIAALGYFVDLFDLVLFGVVRVKSLETLGYSGQDLIVQGGYLLNIQMFGMLLGGWIWGSLGDRLGRTSTLIASIFVYSCATLMNAFVQDIPSYAFARLIAGFGLAGELGAAVALVTESLPHASRGLGSVIIVGAGFVGAAIAAASVQSMDWRHAYILGGMLGFALLLARLRVQDSKLYQDTKVGTQLHFGRIRSLFNSSRRIRLFWCSILCGVPCWYAASVMTYFSPELAKELNVSGTISSGNAIMMSYFGAFIGDFACGALAQFLKSRKKPVFIFIVFGAIITIAHPYILKDASSTFFYGMRFLIGFGSGFIGVLLVWVAELFGTNLRVTAISAISNLIRASSIPLVIAFQKFIPSMGLNMSATVLGCICYSLSVMSVFALPETFTKDLRFSES